jgi:serine/threonine protein kinase
MAQLSHANVVSVYDVGIFEGDVFVAMEYVKGTTLRGWTAGRERSWSEVVDLTRRRTSARRRVPARPPDCA